jgi:hypothetical protein
MNLLATIDRGTSSTEHILSTKGERKTATDLNGNLEGHRITRDDEDNFLTPRSGPWDEDDDHFVVSLLPDIKPNLRQEHLQLIQTLPGPGEEAKDGNFQRR